MIEDEKLKIIESIHKRYGDEYRYFKWVTDNEASAAEAERSAVLDSVKNNILLGCNGTKPYYIDIPPGCKYCGSGTWSCLFINGKCNGHCFFCPSEQKLIDVPGTNSLQFTSPVDYLDYLNIFGIRGVSISGGEPLLTPDRSIKYLSSIQHRFGNNIHKWLYTNGTFLTEEALKKLRGAGLNEIRLNLAAQDFNMEKIKLASLYIDTVTVEIPAIPEDYERLNKLLPHLPANGAKFLNLHQLRCTTYNYRKFMKRGYTFLHGPDITVLESELTALKLIKSAVDSGLELPINYCSFVYRNSFQRIGARKRAAAHLAKSFEEVTGTGIIRNLSIKLTKEEAGRITSAMRNDSASETSVHYDPGSMRFSFAGNVLKYMDKKIPVILSYYDSTLNESASYRNVFKDIRMNHGKKITAERWRALPDIELMGEEILIFKRRYLDKSHTKGYTLRSDKWSKISSMEEPYKGLQSYW